MYSFRTQQWEQSLLVGPDSEVVLSLEPSGFNVTFLLCYVEPFLYHIRRAVAQAKLPIMIRSTLRAYTYDSPQKTGPFCRHH